MAEERRKSSRIAEKQLKKAGQTLQEDAKSLGSFAGQAARSGAYTYPLRGALYLLSHPKLYKPIQPLIMKALTYSVGILVGMFVLTYLPQVAVLAVVSGPLAFIAAVPVVLAESYFLITALTRTFIRGDASDQLFDAVLAQRGFEDLVERGRSVKKSGGGVVLGNAILKPIRRFSAGGIARYLITLPLNAIPGVGTLFFLYVNGKSAGPTYHDRYFQLKGLSNKDKAEFVQSNQAAYTAFGAASLALSLIPVVGSLTAFTSAVGAALWAADLEKAQRKSSTAPAGDESKKDAVEVRYERGASDL